MTKHLESDNRIHVLDGFRFLAIVSVLLYHFYSRWTTPIAPFNLYPYGSDANYFKYGYMGVEFFFIISGFVIAYTLHSNINLITFLKKRWIRLFPAMLICSVITFFTLSALDTNKVFSRSQDPGNLLVSLTFIHPSVINALFKPLHLSYINGSYWSLWPEVQFYLLAGIIYFSDPKKFFSRFFFIAIILFLLCKSFYFIQENKFSHPGAENLFLNYGHKFFDIFNLSSHILWFLLGVIFFHIYSKKLTRLSFAGIITTALMQLFDLDRWETRLMCLTMLFLFLIFIYYPKYLRFLHYRLFAQVGLASYSIYLIHENIGVELINKYAASFGSCSVLFPLVIMVGLFAFGLILFYCVEKPIMNFLKQKLIGNKSPSLGK